MMDISADDAVRSPSRSSHDRLGSPKTVRTGLGPVVAALVLVHACPVLAAEATAWAKGAHSAARLIDGGPAGAGARVVGLELRLDPAFITYWRDPGDAGVPPTFDTGGSVNLKSADVRYPAPMRLDEAGATAFGYTGDVIFPIDVVPLDPTKPIGLRIDLAYAVCHDICLPARARLAIDLDGPPSAEASRVAEASEAVPPVTAIGRSAGPLAILSLAPTAAGGVSVEAKGPPGSTLFVEAPDAFVFEAGAPRVTGDGRLMFPVKRVDGPDRAPVPPLTLTLVSPGEPRYGIEVHVQLDAATKTP